MGQANTRPNGGQQGPGLAKEAGPPSLPLASPSPPPVQCSLFGLKSCVYAGLDGPKSDLKSQISIGSHAECGSNTRRVTGPPKS
jgi:hypothetical protein